jgi:hypothetical protein
VALKQKRVPTLVILAALTGLPGFAREEATDPAEALRGTWRGTSTCVDKATDTSCHDEVVIYEFEAAGQPRGRVVWRPSKVVNGSVLPMGELELAWDAAEKTWSKEFTSPRFHGRWSLTVEGPKMTGSLVELPSGRLVRRVAAARDEAKAAGDSRRLEALHGKVMAAHRRSDVEMLLGDEAEDYVVASRGEVTHPGLDERRARLGAYLESTKFEEYRDVIDPIVRVSPDGLLGWVVVQVKARGVQTGAAGEKAPIAFVSAWIELYENRNGRWYRVGNVSNFKPE